MSFITTATDESDTNGSELSDGEIYDILSNRRRRFVIHALKRTDGPVDISDISAHVAAWELKKDPDEVCYDDRRSVYTTLRRTHLPKLEQKGVVTVDTDENAVRATSTLQDLDIYVEALGRNEIPWSLYYVGLAGVAVVLLLAVVVDALMFAALDPLDVGLFTVTSFGVSSVVHHVTSHNTHLGNTEKPPELHRQE